MAQDIDLGKISLTPKGTWTMDVQVEYNDVWAYSNAKFLALQNSKGVAPSDDGVYWYQLSLSGDSAYEVAIKQGFVGTEEEWIQSLKQPATDAAAMATAAVESMDVRYGEKIEEIKTELESTVDDAVADRVARPLLISEKEIKVGAYKIGGEDIDIYERSVRLLDLPQSVDETIDYVVADEPLGYGLYFKVESLVVSTGKGLSAQFFNQNYEVSGYVINNDFQSVITIKCKAAVPDAVDGILHVRYCKFEGEMIEMTLNLSTSDPIDTTNFIIPPLKYNKKFAISMSTDDTGADDYAKIFQYFNGGFINSLVDGNHYWHNGMLFPDGGWLSRALTYTDGCGVQRRFPVQSASWFNLRNQYWSGPVKDIEPIELTRSASGWPFLYWQDIEEMLDFDGAVSLHDVQDPAVDDYAGGTIQEIINGINDAQDNYIYPRLGRKLLIMTEPNGDYKYVEAALQIPEIKLITRQQSEGGFSVIDVNTIDISTKVKLIRYFSDSGSLQSHKDWFLANIIAPSLSNGDKMYGDFGMHGFGQNGGSYTFETLPTMNKPMFFDWLCDTYGEEGSDELWFCTQDEFICYQLTKAQTTIKVVQEVDKVHLKIFIPRIPNVHWNEISILYEGANLPVTSVEVPGSVVTLSHANTTDGFMINLSTNDRLLVNAEKYTSYFESVYDSEETGLVKYALGNANYFIQRLNPALQNPFTSRIQALIAAPTLISIVINGGELTTQSQSVSITINKTGGNPTHYRAGESSDLSAVSWIPYVSDDVTFFLSDQFGAKTVYLQLMNAFGNSLVVSDTIELVEADLALNSITINGGDLSTNDPVVSILFNFVGSATHYMVSESSIFDGASWVAMENPVNFTLSSGSYGSKTVYAKLKNDNTLITSDTKSATIELLDTVTIVLDSIQINGGDSYTGSDSVLITPSYSNTPTHYRVGESADLSLETWIPYTSGDISYTLSTGYGVNPHCSLIMNRS
jgi:hypothetical protein